MKLDYKVIGNRIKEIRTAKGWTQAKLAEKSDVEPSYVSHIERGVTKLSLPTLISIANALDTTLDDVVYTNLKKSTHISFEMIEKLLSDCTPEEISSIVEVVKTTKNILRMKKQ